MNVNNGKLRHFPFLRDKRIFENRRVNRIALCSQSRSRSFELIQTRKVTKYADFIRNIYTWNTFKTYIMIKTLGKFVSTPSS
jgi:hypothetical protein